MLEWGVQEGGGVLEGGRVRVRVRVRVHPCERGEGALDNEGGLGGPCRGQGGCSMAWDSTSWDSQGRAPAWREKTIW